MPVYKTSSIPDSSLLKNDPPRFHYCDSYNTTIKLSQERTIDSITTTIFRLPLWVNLLLRLRNTIVRIFGLQAGKPSENIMDYYPVGSRAVYFTVIMRNENELVLSEKDKHLDFWVSILRQKQNQGTNISLTTLVHFHNIWGRFYFFPVKPFHQLIMKSLMHRLRLLENDSSGME
jgi:hypothetical protein